MSPSANACERSAGADHWIPRLRAVQQELAAEDGRALAQLIRSVLPILVRCSRRWLQEHPDADDTAEDVAQVAALRIARGVDHCRATTDDQFVSWIVAVAKNVLRDELNASGRRIVVRRTDPDGKGSFTRYAFDEWAHGWREPPCDAELTLTVLTDRALAALPDETARLVWSHVVEHAPWAAIAGLIHTTPAAAKRRFQRAQRALRRFVLDAALELPPDARANVLRALQERATFDDEDCRCRCALAKARAGRARGGATPPAPLETSSNRAFSRSSHAARRPRVARADA